MKKYKIEDIETLSAKLKALPVVEKKKQEVSKSEAIALLRSEIKELQLKRGYTMKMIADILKENNLEITESVLKSYLQRTAKKSTQKTARSVKAKEPSHGSAEKVSQVTPVVPVVKKANVIDDVD